MAAGTSQAVLTIPRPGFPGATRALRRAVVSATLVAGDLAVAAAGGMLGYALPVSLDVVPQVTPLPIPPLFVIFPFLMLGLYAEWGLGPVERLRIRGIGVAFYAAASIGLSLATTGISLGVALAVLSAAIVMFAAGHYVEGALRRRLVTWRRWGVPVALIGAEAASRDLAQFLHRHPEFGLRPIGMIRATDELTTPVQPASFPFPVLGDLADAERLSRSIELAIVVDAEGLASRLVRLPFRHVVTVQAGRLSANTLPRVCSLGGTIGFDLRRDIYRRSSLTVKRCLDLLLVLPVLVVVVPVILLLAGLIKLISPGPAFFRQERVGRKGRMFDMLKLRTMHVDAGRRLEEHLAADPAAREEWARFYKLRNDPRVLPGIGQFMRRTSLDELPQLINVLFGQMSLVGPRPFPDYHLQAFDEEFRTLRESVPPGLTGFWQISARSEGDLAVQQVQDSFYITNWSFWLDLYVILRTPVVVISGAGAR